MERERRLEGWNDGICGKHVGDVVVGGRRVCECAECEMMHAGCTELLGSEGHVTNVLSGLGLWMHCGQDVKNSNI